MNASNVIRSKTMWFAAATAVVGVVQQIAPFIPPQYSGIALAVAGVLTAYLRTVTTQPLESK